jgi:hypothetical protein
VAPVPSVFRYVRATGSFATWHYLVFAAFAGWLGYLRFSSVKPSFAHYLFIFLLPVAAGTGLLTTARSGQFDFLFGAGEHRNRVWRAALVHAWVLPIGMGMVTFALAGTSWRVLWLRLPAVLCFTCGVSFAVGLIDLRYVTGVVWILVRMLFVMIPAGLTASMHLSKGPTLPPASVLTLMLFAVPESALEMNMPILYPVIGALVGVFAIIGSYLVFLRADFGGKRT